MIETTPSKVTRNRPGFVAAMEKMIRQVKWEEVGAKYLGEVCALLLAGLLSAGLWPFHAPRNHVQWLPSGSGLAIGRPGTILTSGAFQAANEQQNAPCSIEIWLEPRSSYEGGTLLAFYSGGRVRRQFALEQSVSDLVLSREVRPGYGRRDSTKLYVGDIFRKGKPLFITITASAGRTSVYINGAIAQLAPKFSLSASDLDGNLVIATAPATNDSWSGVLRGLAIYGQELTPEQVLHHYSSWTGKGRPDIADTERATAVYLFSERAGHLVHNQVTSGVGLYIPKRYMLLDEAFFTPFWEEFDPGWGYAQDILINIGGLIPLGLLFYPYLLSRKSKRPALFTILLGFAVSLTIETLQGFLPTRNSGTTDLFTNTLGTAIGVGLYRLWFLHIDSPRVRAFLNSPGEHAVK